MGRYTHIQQRAQRNTHAHEHESGVSGAKPFPSQHKGHSTLWTSKSLSISSNAALQLSHLFLFSSFLSSSLLLSRTLKRFHSFSVQIFQTRVARTVARVEYQVVRIENIKSPWGRNWPCEGVTSLTGSTLVFTDPTTSVCDGDQPQGLRRSVSLLHSPSQPLWGREDNR